MFGASSILAVPEKRRASRASSRASTARASADIGRRLHRRRIARTLAISSGHRFQGASSACAWLRALNFSTSNHGIGSK
jgi:hypothetical protein